MSGIAIEARRIAANIAKLPGLLKNMSAKRAASDCRPSASDAF